MRDRGAPLVLQCRCPVSAGSGLRVCNDVGATSTSARDTASPQDQDETCGILSVPTPPRLVPLRRRLSADRPATTHHQTVRRALRRGRLPRALVTAPTAEGRRDDDQLPSRETWAGRRVDAPASGTIQASLPVAPRCEDLGSAVSSQSAAGRGRRLARPSSERSCGIPAGAVRASGGGLVEVDPDAALLGAVGQLLGWWP